MSMFRTMTVNCPQCDAAVEFKVVISVNADRRPDLRAAILDGTFQCAPCSKCGKVFRLDPELTYFDVGRGQWINAYPVAKLGHWRELEENARAAFAKGYGSQAPAAAREMGAGLKPRITFGWGGLREKLVAVEHKLDDVILELAKLAIVRTSNTISLSSEIELRLIDVEEDKLVMAWIRAETEEVTEGLKVPRKLYADISANEEGWAALKRDLSRGLFVDTNRLMVEAV